MTGDLIDLGLPAKASSSRVARGALRRAAGATLAPDLLDDAVLAMSEAINNVVLHAYRDPLPVGVVPTVTVRISVRGDTVEILVADRGGGFRAGEHAPYAGLGTGCVLIDALADETRMFSSRAGTIVVMWFGPPAGSPISAAGTPFEG